MLKPIAAVLSEKLGDGDCEELSGGLLNQPANTISSLGFVAVGVWLWTRLRFLEGGERLWAGLFGLMVLLNGLGSVAYHGPQFDGAKWLHDAPVVGVLLIGVGVPLWRLSQSRASVPGWSRSILLAVVALGVVAAGSYFFGRTASSLCVPDSLAQPHGLWHLSTAALMGVWAIALWPKPRSEQGRRED